MEHLVKNVCHEFGINPRAVIAEIPILDDGREVEVPGLLDRTLDLMRVGSPDARSWPTDVAYWMTPRDVPMRGTDYEDKIRNEVLWLAFMPVVDGHGGLVGAEALLRDDKDESRAPMEFMRICEKIGLADRLDEKVLFLAKETLSRWLQDRTLGWSEGGVDVTEEGGKFRLAVNLRPSFIARRLLGIIKSWPAAILVRLEIELLESGELPMGIDEVLREVVALGVSVAIDDFGTGQANYSSIMVLPRSNRYMCKIKIDRSFVSGGGRLHYVCRNISTTGKEENVIVAAEGVDSEEKFNALKDIGVERFQGEYISLAVKESEMLAWLRIGGKPDA